MARDITVTLYTYDELSERAKERARQWWIEALGSDEWYDSTYEDAKEVLGFLGFENVEIGFSGFSSQGDGAHFTGRWRAANVDADGLKAHAPVDAELHRFAAAFAEIAKQYPEAFFMVSHSGHYQHEYCTDFDFELEWPDAEDAPIADEVRREVEKRLTDTSRAAMRWVYRQLEGDYEGQTSEEAIADAMEVNGYEFTADGKRTDG